ncbi:MAG: SMP-30/gluconolactonase/LRE family protein [Ramlibacter sp.]|nr:SMP-30/gluconolactonase/LRE family protein [Ramlibacter sp.]
MSAWQTAFAHRCELGESPFWHSQEKRLYWVDIPGRQLHRGDPATGELQSQAVAQEPGCMAPARSGGLVLALRDGVYRVREWGTGPVLLARFNHDPATTRFNDGKADPLGRFWAGTMYEPRDARRAELFSVDCRPQVAGAAGTGAPVVQLKAQNGVIANGLAWSPDAATVYWTDTTHHLIQAWDWNADSNGMSGHRVFRQFPAKPAGWQPGQPGYGGRPDGAAVDAQGNYWVAMFEGGRVLKLSPGGQTLAEFPTPAQCPTMPCFGGDDLRTLYLTTARHGRPADELARYPDSGCVFSMRVDVPGLPVNFFID